MSELHVRIPRFLRWRSYQGELWNAMIHDGAKRAMVVWHRRAGKDLTVLNIVIQRMLMRPGTYYYFFPSYAQAKKVIWDGQDKAGRPFLSNFPPELIGGKWEDELKLRLDLPDGRFSTFQLIGVDKLGQDKAGDSIVGTNPVMVVFSEYSLMSERAWNLMRPVLRENDGTAVFVFTPRGKNHAYDMWRAVQQNPNWFTSLRTVDDTRRDAEGEDGAPVVVPADIEEDLKEGMDPALVKQEYYCSFEGALSGSYYGDLLVRAREEGRIRPGLYDPNRSVDTAWDLGVDDATAIGFTQTVQTPAGPRVRWIDYAEGSGYGLEHYVSLLKAKRYGYAQHYGPHDLKVTEWGTGNTRLQRAGKMGVHFTVVPKLFLADGIEAVRRLLTISEFDEERIGPDPENKLKRGLLAALMAYRREWDDKLATWKSNPVHDWASHPADMVRYRAIAYYDLSLDSRKSSYDGGWSPYEADRPKEEYEDWNPFDS